MKFINLTCQQRTQEVAKDAEWVRLDIEDVFHVQSLVMSTVPPSGPRIRVIVDSMVGIVKKYEGVVKAFVVGKEEYNEELKEAFDNIGVELVIV